METQTVEKRMNVYSMVHIYGEPEIEVDIHKEHDLEYASVKIKSPSNNIVLFFKDSQHLDSFINQLVDKVVVKEKETND